MAWQSTEILPWEQNRLKALFVADAVPLCSCLTNSKLKHKPARLYHCVLPLKDSETYKKISRTALHVTAVSTHSNTHGFSGHKIGTEYHQWTGHDANNDYYRFCLQAALQKDSCNKWKQPLDCPSEFSFCYAALSDLMTCCVSMGNESARQLEFPHLNRSISVLVTACEWETGTGERSCLNELVMNPGRPFAEAMEFFPLDSLSLFVVQIQWWPCGQLSTSVLVTLTPRLCIASLTVLAPVLLVLSTLRNPALLLHRPFIFCGQPN